jgi:hypothetical protein
MPGRPQSSDQEGKRGDTENPPPPTLAKSLGSTELESSPLTMGRSNVHAYEGLNGQGLCGDKHHMEICSQKGSMGLFTDRPGRSPWGCSAPAWWDQAHFDLGRPSCFLKVSFACLSCVPVAGKAAPGWATETVLVLIYTLLCGR